MGSLVKLFDATKTSPLFRICSAIYPQIHRNLAEASQTVEKKRPASAFASFYREKQASLKQDNPDLSQPQLMKLASTLWSNESFITKQQFKNEYTRKMEQYKEETKVPKRPVPPYLKFFQENNRSLQWQYPELKERAREAGRMWNALSDYEKDKYRNQYAQEMLEFQENLTDHDKDLIRNKREALQKQRARKEVRRFGKEGLKERPKAPVNNAFNVYISMHSSEVPKEQNVFQYLSEKWNNLSETDKQSYKQKLDEVTENYERELSEWQAKYDKHAK